MTFRSLPAKNLSHHAGRTALLALLVSALAFAMVAGSLVTQGLRRGLTSLEERLGADVVVAPKSAKSTTDLQKVMVEGVPGYFYMDDSYVAKVAALEGVERVSPQYYLASVKAGCCTMPVQIIGIDPKTDFTIQPWIARSYADDLGLLDVVAGCNITGAPGTKIMFYGTECRIVAKLDETGTALDNAVFGTAQTIKALIAASEEQGLAVLTGNDPEHVVSTIQVKVADGYQVSDVTDEINLHVRGVTAVQARAMTSGIADGVAGASRMVGALVVAVWVLAALILVAAFLMLGRQRVREFAVLRVMGASRTMLARLVVQEALILSVAGAVVGTALGLVVVLLFNKALESALGLPFLLPSAGAIAAVAALACAVASLAGPLASAWSALRLSRVDPGQSLREE